MGFDLILRGGLLVDGTGAAGRLGDVGVREGHIAAVGDLPGSEGETVYDCSGQVVCPGFVDLHGHSDLTLLANPRAESKVHMGVTAECSGQCGMGVYPCRPEDRELLGAACSFIAAPVDVEWITAAEYMECLRAARPSLNVAPMVGQSALRAGAMGFENRPATAEEIARMCEAAREAFAAGAVGISLGLAYALGSFSQRDELLALCGEAAAHDRHISVHLRNEALHQLEALDEMLSIAREVSDRGRLRLEIDHLKCSGPASWGRMPQVLAKIEAAAAEGLDIAFDLYPYIAGSRHLTGSLPAWMHSGGNAALVGRLRDPECRAQLRAEHEAALADSTARRPFELDFAAILVTDVQTEDNQWTIGLRLDEIAQRRGQEPLEATLDLLAEEACEVNCCLFSMCEEDMRLALTHPLGCVATDGLAFAPYGVLSRGKPHPRSYGTYPRLLGHYVREEKLLSLPEAIRKSTSLPASRLKLGDRGCLRAGYWADLVVFNPNTIADTATYESPHQYPQGVSLVVVNGQVTVAEGEHTGAGAGQLIGPG